MRRRRYFKLILSFYQVVAVLPSVYDARLPSEYTRWVPTWLNADPFQLLLPAACVGNFLQRLLLRALLPLAVLCVVLLLIVITVALEHLAGHRPPDIADLDKSVKGESFPACDSGSGGSWTAAERAEQAENSRIRAAVRRRRRSIEMKSLEVGPTAMTAGVWRTALIDGACRALPVALFVLYFVLPSITSAIFQTFNCEHFEEDSADHTYESFLKSDPSVRCSGPEYARTVSVAIVLCVLLTLGVPAFFAVLLLRCRANILANQQTRLVRATAFLHGSEAAARRRRRARRA